MTTCIADLPVGCGLPGVVKSGRLQTAANIDPGWVGWPAEERIGAAIGRRTWIVNDADAAGLAEVAYGAGKGQRGVVLLLTIGTGIGSGLFVDGVLMPNTELGHLEFHGKDAETRISGAARERRHTSWRTWGREFNDYLARVERYLWPDLIILGGGVSKEYAKFAQYLQTRARLATAAYLNTSGIIGAAYAAAAAAGQRMPRRDFARRPSAAARPRAAPTLTSTLTAIRPDASPATGTTVTTRATRPELGPHRASNDRAAASARRHLRALPSPFRSTSPQRRRWPAGRGHAGCRRERALAGA